MKKLVFTLMICSAVSLAFGQAVSDKVIRDYVSNHKDLAIQEMEAYKIPASITLAQAIYASKAGTNRVAKEANNHFGITCHANEWVGDTYYETEDHSPDYCYRKYADVENSYRDHSLFLAKRPRYVSLFELPMSDYRAWARGLKEAGYAGNPRYADTLIAIIQKYDLAKYDASVKQEMGKPVEIKKQSQKQEVDNQSLYNKEHDKGVKEELVTQKDEVQNQEETFDFPKTTPRIVDDVHVFVLDPKSVPFQQAYFPYTKRAVYENNKTKFLLAKAGDTYASLASSLQMTEKSLRLFNDVFDNSEPVEGEVVYLEMKSTKSPVGYHILSEKDTYHYVSQLYGVQLKILIKRNSGALKNYKVGDRICIGCK
jgi:hypothetical protein